MATPIKKKVNKEYKTPTASQFNRMNRLEKRVAIARDVLEQLKIGLYKEMQGTYFSFTNPAGDCSKSSPRSGFYIGNSKISVQKILTEPDSHEKIKCEVCAKGAAVCSLARIVNKRTFSQLNSRDPEIKKIFGPLMWAEMEAMFEGEKIIEFMPMKDRDLIFGKLLDDPGIAGDYCRENKKLYVANDYRRQETPMADIMQNIIKNKGKLRTQHRTLIS